MANYPVGKLFLKLQAIQALAGVADDKPFEIDLDQMDKIQKYMDEVSSQMSHETQNKLTMKRGITMRNRM